MTKFNMLALAFLCIAGCSSSNNNDTVDSGVDNNGMDNNGTGSNQGGSDASVESIASAPASSEAVELDIVALQSSLNALQGTEPVPVEIGDTVQGLLAKAQEQ